ncbi:MAG: hypothetical protein ACRDQF_21870, partial [Thermocrispum sp.]
SDTVHSGPGPSLCPRTATWCAPCPTVSGPRWASRLLPTTTVDAVIARLDAGQPDPGSAAARIDAVVQGVIAAARVK